MGHPWPLFVKFWLFKQTIQLLQQINVKKCPSSIRCWDSNSPPLEHKSHPITTRPGLSIPLTLFLFLYFFLFDLSFSLSHLLNISFWFFDTLILQTTLFANFSELSKTFSFAAKLKKNETLIRFAKTSLRCLSLVLKNFWFSQ